MTTEMTNEKKPLCKFVGEVVENLTRDYVELPNYSTKRCVRKGVRLEQEEVSSDMDESS